MHISKPDEYVSLVSGDMILGDLGISSEDYEVLTREVQHCKMYTLQD